MMRLAGRASPHFLAINDCTMGTAQIKIEFEDEDEDEDEDDRNTVVNKGHFQ